MIESVDGQRVDSLDALVVLLRRHDHETSIQVIFRRWSDSSNRIFEYHERELPGETLQLLGPKGDSVSIATN